MRYTELVVDVGEIKMQKKLCRKIFRAESVGKIIA
jgi:hypothetical protein